MSTESEEENEVNELDAPYHPEVMKFIREHLHQTIVRKLTAFDKSDYLISWNENDYTIDPYSTESNEIRIPSVRTKAGRCVHISLGCKPSDGEVTERLVRNVMASAYIIHLRRYNHVVRRSDAIAWYGVEIEGHITPVEQRKESRRYDHIVDKYVKVTTIDRTNPKKRVSVMVRGDVFTALNEAIKIIEGR